MTNHKNPLLDRDSAETQSSVVVSVVIPVFNRPVVLRRALESVAAQDIGNLEAVVVDDGSVDASAVIKATDGIKGLSVRVVRHEANLGGAAARNTGVRNAKGRYIAFLDSDDEWLPGKLAEQLEVARHQPDDNWLVYCQSLVMTSERQGGCDVWPQRCMRYDEPVGDYLFAARGFIQTSSFFLPRSLVEKIPFSEGLRRHQDYDVLLRFEFADCRFLMVPKPLVVVHWEDLHVTKRGLSPEGSFAFLEQYGQFLSPKARSGFILQQIVLRSLRGGSKRDAWMALMRHVQLRYVSLSTWFHMLSLYIFGDARIVRSLARIKARILGRRSSRPVEAVSESKRNLQCPRA
jgi:glycosyltransferase involved in cell wall biosynthesis